MSLEKLVSNKNTPSNVLRRTYFNTKLKKIGWSAKILKNMLECWSAVKTSWEAGALSK